MKISGVTPCLKAGSHGKKAWLPPTPAICLCLRVTMERWLLETGLFIEKNCAFLSKIRTFLSVHKLLDRRINAFLMGDPTWQTTSNRPSSSESICVCVSVDKCALLSTNDHHSASLTVTALPLTSIIPWSSAQHMTYYHQSP